MTTGEKTRNAAGTRGLANKGYVTVRASRLNGFAQMAKETGLPGNAERRCAASETGRERARRWLESAGPDDGSCRGIWRLEPSIETTLGLSQNYCYAGVLGLRRAEG